MELLPDTREERSRFLTIIAVHLLVLLGLTLFAHWSLFSRGRIMAEEGQFFMEKAFGQIMDGKPFSPFLYRGQFLFVPWIASYIAAFFPVNAQLVFPWIALIPYIAFAFYSGYMSSLVHAIALRSQGRNLLISNSLLVGLLSSLLMVGGVTIFNDPEVFMTTTNSQWLIGLLALLRVFHICLFLSPVNLLIFAVDVMIILSSLPAAVVVLLALLLGFVSCLFRGKSPLEWLRRFGIMSAGLLCGTAIQVLLSLFNRGDSTHDRMFDLTSALAIWLTQGVLAPFAPGPLMFRLLNGLRSFFQTGDFTSFFQGGFLSAFCIAWIGILAYGFVCIRSIRHSYFPSLPPSIVLILALGSASSLLFTFLGLGDKVDYTSVFRVGRYFFIQRGSLFIALCFVLLGLPRQVSMCGRLFTGIALIVSAVPIVSSGAYLFVQGTPYFCLQSQVNSAYFTKEQIADLRSGRIKQVYASICPKIPGYSMRLSS